MYTSHAYNSGFNNRTSGEIMISKNYVYESNNNTFGMCFGDNAIEGSVAAVANSLSDTDTESAPIIVKRPILIRGDVEFLKNFPARSFANESTYYSTDNRTVEVFFGFKFYLLIQKL